MATNEYPQRNINYPFTKDALAAARARLAPKMTQNVQTPIPSGGKGSLREVRKGEWIDDRVIDPNGPASPSDEGRQEPKRESKALPTFSNTKVYSVELSKPVLQDGQWLKPAISYQMVGAVCASISGSILDATELGDIPVDPDVEPTAAKGKKG